MKSFSTLGESRRRRRRQTLWSLIKFVVVAGLVGGAAAIFYEIGTEKVQAQLRQLETKLSKAENEADQLRDSAATAVEAAEQARDAAEDIRLRYAREVPRGERKALLSMLEKKIETGMPVERLAFLINAATIERICDEELETKRTALRTPIGRQPEGVASFANGRIVVTGRGKPSKNEAGQALAWYDPAEPVVMSFRKIDGSNDVKEEVLPVTHSIVQGNNEYRFNVSEGRTGYVQVSMQRCDFP